jgi:hypothetical protein
VRNRSGLIWQVVWVLGACAVWLTLSLALWVPQIAFLVTVTPFLPPQLIVESFWVGTAAATIRFLLALLLTWLAITRAKAPRSIWVGVLIAQIALVAALGVGQQYFSETAPWWQYVLYHGGNWGALGGATLGALAGSVIGSRPRG